MAAQGSFERGVSGVDSDVAQIRERTASVVGYIGEWHSHPDGSTTEPSRADCSQLSFLAEHLRDEGVPL